MGGGYSDVYGGFVQSILRNAKDGKVNIAVLAMTYSTNPFSITEGERKTNLTDAERRRFEVEEACKRAAPQGVTCSAFLLPVFTRDDASAPEVLALLNQPISAAFMLGGDQTVAMQVLANTPLESRLEELYQSGAVFGGTSAGSGVQSYFMLGGYKQNFAAGNSLFFGAVDMWNEPDRRGLNFGIKSALIDQHFFQRGRAGRLLNAVCLPDAPHVGIGVDAYTGLQISDERIVGGVFGLYDVAVLDAETYRAADGARYLPLGGGYVLSARNVLTHLLAQGDFTYDLETRQHSLKPYLPVVKRNFDSLRAPNGAGTLILAGDLSKALEPSPVLAEFIQLAGGENARVLILSAGYPSQRSAQTNAETYRDALGGAKTEIIALEKNADSPAQIPSGISGILLIGKDAALMNPAALAPVKEAWLKGIPVLADNAAASLLGAAYANHGPTPGDAEQEERLTQKALIDGVVEIRDGLGLLPVSVEPRMLQDNRWGRFFALGYQRPKNLVLGLNDATAIRIDSQGARVLGDNAVFVLDLRGATLKLGTNGGFAIANGLMDVFAPGEILAAQDADVNAQIARAATPALPTTPPTPAPTLTSAPTLTAPPTASPQPASAPQKSKSFSAWEIAGLIALALAVLALWRRLRGEK